jgi:hypothetical protein
MNRIQKMSWLLVVCIGTAVILSSITVSVLYFFFGFPVAWAGLSFLGLSGFGGLGPVIFKKDPGPVICDERDRLINMKAARAGFAISYGVFGLLCMGIWEYYRFHSVNTIKIDVLPMLFAAAGLTAFFTHAVTILVLYGKDNKQTEGGVA